MMKLAFRPIEVTINLYFTQSWKRGISSCYNLIAEMYMDIQILYGNILQVVTLSNYNKAFQ